ncbi:MAG: GAF domain-containing protein [Desulfobacterales bacterium]|nr:GAF domain-containing protein [Desulfobacterales bacterium]
MDTSKTHQNQHKINNRDKTINVRKFPAHHKLDNFLQTVTKNINIFASSQVSRCRDAGIDALATTLEKDINGFSEKIVSDIKDYALDQVEYIEQSARIGIALSVEKNINKLLEMIVDHSRTFSHADAGTLYTVNDDKRTMSFKILQNDSMNIRMGVSNGKGIKFQDVPLYIDDKPNNANVSSYVAISGKTVNIPDVYEAEGFDFTGPKKYDESTGYRSKSMLVIPLKNHENEIIGVLQLLNSQKPGTTEVIPFSEEYVELVESLASQAAVSLTNAQLIQDLRNLFDAFIKTIATAIDEKSPYTGGHVSRVVKLTMLIAEKVNQATSGSFKDISLSDEEMEELRLAAWMHDVGKITTPEYVVDKQTKLETIFDRIHLIETRFNMIAGLIQNEGMEKKLTHLQNGISDTSVLNEIDRQTTDAVKAVYDDLEFIKKSNTPGEFMTDDHLARVKQISEKTYNLKGTQFNFLDENEMMNLNIRKGSLTDEERDVIQNHVTMSIKMLSQLPFPKGLTRVPEYAGAHHEKIDGTGYPLGLSGEKLSLQGRIMAIADIFEALTAKDRPYKKPMPLSQAVKIMGFMKKDRHIDADIHDLFIDDKIYYDYAKKELNPEQIDE